MIKMSITNIRKSMSHEKNYLDWKNILTTNCYAFALGIDIPEENICKYAYDIGGISRTIDSDEIIDPSILDSYEDTYDIDLACDFETLGLEYEESNNPEFFCKDIPSYPGRYFDILLFLSSKIDDFHFARYGKNGKLYHKRGFFLPPEETTIKFIEEDKYQFVKRYRLYLSRR